MSWGSQLTTNLIASFAGVILALFVAQAADYKAERFVLAAMFDQVRNDMMMERAYCRVWADADRTLPTHVKPDTRSFDELANNPLLAKHSPYLASGLLFLRRMLGNERSSLLDAAGERRTEQLREYVRYLDLSVQMAQLGSNLFHGNIGHPKAEEDSMALIKASTKPFEKKE